MISEQEMSFGARGERELPAESCRLNREAGNTHYTITGGARPVYNKCCTKASTLPMSPAATDRHSWVNPNNLAAKTEKQLIGRDMKKNINMPTSIFSSAMAKVLIDCRDVVRKGITVLL